MFLFPFQNNAYWWFVLLSTMSDRRMTRWTLGDHASRGRSSDSVSSHWFSDRCWKRIYEHDKTGAQISGSLADLVNAVKAGHRVKIFYQRISLEADELRIRNGHVCASFLNGLSKSGTVSFESSVKWVWKMACTTGNLKTLQYKVGANTYVNSSTESQTLSWFIDDREWKKVLSTSHSGAVLSGSKAVLQNHVRLGAEVRYRLLLDHIEAGFSISQQADNIGLSGEETWAMHVRSVSVEFDGVFELKFKSDPFWWFTIVATTGRKDISRWSVGAHTDRSHNSDRGPVDWFVNA